MKSLREVVENVGMSRRVIQEYEAAGIVRKPKDRDKYGYLCYNDEEVEKLWLVRFYRELGYSKNEIKNILEEPFLDRQKAMGVQIAQLIKKKEQLEQLIEEVTAMSKLNMTPDTLRFGMPNAEELGDLTYDDAALIISSVSEAIPDEMDIDIIIDELMEENEFEQIVEEIMLCYDMHMNYSSDQVQAQVKKLYDIFSEKIAASVLAFSECCLGFAFEEQVEKRIHSLVGEEKRQFLRQTLKFFCEIHSEKNESDSAVHRNVERIIELAQEGYGTGSDVVQEAISNVYCLWDKIPDISESEQLEMMHEWGNVYANMRNKLLPERKEEADMAGFIAEAAWFYCESHSY